ncbi:hypothetical protein LTR49_028188 [Elasticomyces elasticus]|nr:hypothetical protein LTR49_028188 [Elasticomyces elasticus]KAK5736181.1 hypothetical protein LTS12_026262 [Elasticomyces elasticus]
MIGVLVVLGGIALSYIIAEIIRLSLDDAKKYEVVHIQLPKAQTDELSSWNVTEGRFNFDPVNGDPFEVEMNFNPGSKPPSPLSAAKQDNGDIVLTAGSLAAVIDEQFSQALCSRGLGSRALVKRLSLQCMVNRLERLRRAVQEGGAAFAIQYVDPFDFPPPVDDLYQTLFKETSDFADHVTLRANTTAEIRDRIDTYTAIITFAEGAWGLGWTDGKMTIPAAHWKKQQGEDDEECPTEIK